MKWGFCGQAQGNCQHIDYCAQIIIIQTNPLRLDLVFFSSLWTSGAP